MESTAEGGVEGTMESAAESDVHVEGPLDGAVEEEVEGIVEGVVQGIVDGFVDGFVVGAVEDAVEEEATEEEECTTRWSPATVPAFQRIQHGEKRREACTPTTTHEHIPRKHNLSCESDYNPNTTNITWVAGSASIRSAA